MRNIEKLAATLAGQGITAHTGVPLSEKCTFRIGGAADLFVQPCSEDEIAQVFTLAHEHDVPLLVLGRGSNVLFADSGYRGAVLHLGKQYSRIWRQDGHIICESGASLSELCEFAEKNGLAGLEFAHGIPGTVGGALFMNAGAYGGQVSDVIHSARFIDERGQATELNPEQMALDYRHSAFMGMRGAITRATFRLAPGDPAQIRAKMDGFMQRRREKQPLEHPSAGSTFKRPPGNYASALIDDCGLKGLKIGGAAVSEKHAGFVINTGGATAKDVLAVIAAVQQTVREKTGYELECEVKTIDGN